MIDFSKAKDYYAYFNEKDRLFSDNGGKLEFEMTKPEVIEMCRYAMYIGIKSKIQIEREVII